MNLRAKVQNLIPLLTIGGICIREVQDEDLPHIFNLTTDFRTLFLWDDGAFELLECNFVELFRRKAETHTFFVIQEAQEQGQFLGLAYIYSRDQVNEWAYYTVALSPEGRRKGVGFATTVAIVDFAFFTWSLHKIYIEVLSINRAALNTAFKAGFSKEATIKEHRRIAGERIDMILLSIRRDHWYAKARNSSLMRLTSKKHNERK